MLYPVINYISGKFCTEYASTKKEVTHRQVTPRYQM
jgi:hypothetical protein